MYKNFHNRILNLPQGNPNPKVNFFWMLFFLPWLIALGCVVVLMIGAVAQFAFQTLFG